MDVVRSAVASLNNGDIDGYVRYFDPSCLRWAVGLAQPLTLTDIADNFRLLYAAFEGLHVGDYMGFPPKRQSIDVQTCEIYEVADGIVVASWVYGDLGQLFLQIGTEQGDAT